jgi:hypothetical protein
VVRGGAFRLARAKEERGVQQRVVPQRGLGLEARELGPVEVARHGRGDGPVEHGDGFSASRSS